MISLIFGLGLLGATPTAHPMQMTIPPLGISYVEDQAPRLLPEEIKLGPFTFTYAGVDTEMRNTVMNLKMGDVLITILKDDVIRVDTHITGKMDGDVDIAVSSSGILTQSCMQDTLVGGAGVRLITDLRLIVNEDSVPELVFEPSVLYPTGIGISYNADDIFFALSECVLDDLITYGLGYVKDTILEWIETFIIELATDDIVPMLNDMLLAIFKVEGQIDFARFLIALDDAKIDGAGLFFDFNMDLYSPYEAAACLDIPGTEPLPKSSALTTAGNPDAHVMLEVNIGLVEDAIYHVWHSGLLCITDKHIQALGIELDLVPIVSLIPGFPPGTDYELDIRLAEPVEVAGVPGENANLELVIPNLTLEIIGHLPSGETKVVEISTGATASATLELESLSNSLAVRVNSFEIDALEITETVGLDAQRLREVLADYLIGPGLEELGTVSLVSPVFGFGGYYLLPHSLSTSPSQVSLAMNIFKAPDDDFGAPTIFVASKPEGSVRPSEATIVFAASDSEMENVALFDDLYTLADVQRLIRYKLTINGESFLPSHKRSITIGEQGKTGNYDISATALDLAGNESSELHLRLWVDGILPRARLLSEGLVHGTDKDELEINWSMSDDSTSTASLLPKLEVYRFEDPSDATSAEIIDQAFLERGSTSYAMVSKPGVYKWNITIYDEAGNTDSISAIYSVEEKGLGCTQVPLGIIGLVGLMLPFIKRRRRATSRNSIAHS